MKHIIMCVWNDFDRDERIQKKAYSLSKEFKVRVLSVTKKPKKYKIKNYNNNLSVEYFWFTDPFYFIKWLWFRLIFNKKFWKSKLYYSDIYDCNDPDTLSAGVMAKNKFGSKLIYDSHEYWKKTMRKETNILYTIYSYIGNSIQYLREKLYIKNIDDMIVVSPSIQDKIKQNYGLHPHLIMNLSKYNDMVCNQKHKSFVFYGSKIRLGMDKLTNVVKSKGYDLVMVGNPINNKDWINKGFMKPVDANIELTKHKFGICIFNVTCENIKFSLSNKLFSYIQAGVPIITTKDMVDTSNIVNKYNIGVVIDSLTESDINKGVMYLEKNYNILYDNVMSIKNKFSWEHQEDKLLQIYK